MRQFKSKRRTQRPQVCTVLYTIFSTWVGIWFLPGTIDFFNCVHFRLGNILLRYRLIPTVFVWVGRVPYQ